MGRPKLYTDEELRVRRLEYQARYRRTEAYRQAQKKYASSEKRREVSARHYKMMKTGSPERTRAYVLVRHALKVGLLERPAQCFGCDRQTRLYAHHFLGYKPEHALDILWLCQRCHKDAHG